MVGVRGYDRIVNGDCKEVNVTAYATDITLKLGEQLQSKPNFYITGKLKSFCGWKTQCVEKSEVIVAYHYIKEFKLETMFGIGSY